MHAQQEAPVPQEFLALLDWQGRLDLQISPLPVSCKGLADLESTSNRKHRANRTDRSSWRNWIDWTDRSHR